MRSEYQQLGALCNRYTKIFWSERALLTGFFSMLYATNPHEQDEARFQSTNEDGQEKKVVDKQSFFSLFARQIAKQRAGR